MPRFPSSARAENGCNRRVWLICAGLYHSGTHNSKPRFGRGPRRQPPGRRIPRQAAGDIGPNRRGRLGPTDPQWPLPYPAGLWALTRALFRRGGVHAWCGTHVWSWLHPSGGAAHTFEACNLTRTARVQWKDCIQPCDSKLSNVAFGTRRSGLRLPLFWMPRASAQSREQTTVVLRFDLARSLNCLSDTTANVDDRT
jgi:hypothetical protein